MALKKYSDFTNLNDETLAKDIAEARANYHSSKFDHTIKGLANPTELRHMRREVAMMETEVRKREMAEMSADQLEKRSKIRYRRRSK